MAFKKKFKNKQKVPKVLNRKQLRKEKRKQKKVNRNEYYTNRSKLKNEQQDKNTLNSNKTNEISKPTKNPREKPKLEIAERLQKTTKVISTEEQRSKEKKLQKNVEKEMRKQRKEQLLQANLEEDKNIKRLEKQLKLHKRKSKAVPKSFTEDGLDYLLEVCDAESMKSAVATEKELNDVNNDFEEDFALMTGNKIEKKNKKKTNTETKVENSDSESELEYNSESDDSIINNLQDEDDESSEGENISSDEEAKGELSDEGSDESQDSANSEANFNSEEEESSNISESEDEEIKKSTKKPKPKRKFEENDNSNVPNKKIKPKKSDSDLSEIDGEFNEDDTNSEENIQMSSIKGAAKVNSDGTWEDIYGRLRNPDGSVVENQNKYIPPATRAKMEENNSKDKKKLESLSRLKKQLKGLLNRLAEGNMHNIATQVENLYMNNSRNDMNDTLTTLVLESVVSNVITPERLLMEHVLLIIILHANVGTEVGAHFLQTVVKTFNQLFTSFKEVEDKSLDNIVNILSQLYNFKLFDAKLLYEILDRLSDSFKEKDIECILHILKSVGFNLRKDDPIALKNLILTLQKQAATSSDEVKDNARVKFMLDILLAIKNNNVSKIPNYDTSYSEHLKKIMKGFIRKGNYVTQLNISLEDLLKADERGRWWIVGSAWTGNSNDSKEETKNQIQSDKFSSKLLELAKKQRMNTDTRRSIFCILMTAEDYLDAFEKLLKLGLKNQQEREIIHVLLHCCLQEKSYNPYYAVLAQKFCDYDRKYQMTIKYSVWDKLKALNNHSGLQISNLAKLLTYLFLEKGLPISTLKIVQFSELDKISLRFMRQILIGILLHKDLEQVQEVFLKVALSDKLKMFRESLRLFIHHFLLRNLNNDNIPDDQRELLQGRAKVVEKVLLTKENRVKF